MRVRDRIMEWKALLYVQSEVKQEQQLHRWMATEAIACGIKSIAVAEPVTERNILLCAGLLGMELEDCLMIVGSETVWEITKRLHLASLPLVGVSGGSFEGAWIVVEGFDEVDYEFLLRCYQRYHHLPWEILRTERCYLRELTMDDMDALFSLYGQPGVTEYMEGLYERREEEAYQRAYIENMYRYYGYGMWLVCKKDTGEVIGRAGLEHREYQGELELEMGYLIAPSEQRKGYATEVCKAIMKYAGEYLDFPTLNCLIEPENMISVHLVETLGFMYEGKMDVDGTEMNRYIYCFSQKNTI